MKKYYKGILILIIFIVIVAIAIMVWQFWREEHIDRSLITGQPCSPPCWQDITPGVTNQVDATNILRRSTFLDHTSLRVNGDSKDGGCLWEWIVPSKGMLPLMIWRNGTVSEIKLGLTYYVELQDAFNRYGPPEAITSVQGGNPEKWYWSVDLYYPHIGLELRIFTDDFSSEVTPHTEIVAVLYYAPKTLTERIIEKYGSDTSVFVRHWEGFGEIGDIGKYY